MLKIEGLSKTYSKGNIKAVDSLAIHVKRGEIFGFIGPNGAGKTTTLKMITGILKPDNGSIIIDGINIADDPVTAKGKIGYVPDNPDLFERVKGIEYLNLIGDIYDVPRDIRKASIARYLSVFGLEDAAGDLIKSYSHGMKQKLALIGALLHNPPLWILDEPFTGLDPRAAMILKKEMRRHCEEGNTVLFSTHVLEVAEKMCDRVGIIDGGRLIAVGTIEELREKSGGDTSLEDIFFKITGEAEETDD